MKIGDRVRFINEEYRWRILSSYPHFYPPVGTVGRITEIDEAGLVRVQWPKNSTSENDLWWARFDDLEVVEWTWP